jgi:PAS domain S-box-containing protein
VTRLRDLSVGRKLTLISMAVMSLVTVLAAATVVILKERQDRLNMVTGLQTMAHIAGDASAAALAFNDPASAYETLEALSADPHVVAAVLYDPRGKVFAAWRADAADTLRAPPHGPAGHRFGDDALEVFQPIVVSGETAATVYIRSDLEVLRAARHRTLWIATLLMGVALGLTYGLSTRLLRLVTDPITALADVVASVARTRDYSVRALKQSDDELGLLIAGFNEMLDQIEARDRALREAHDSLERRVEERTAEVTEKAAFLEAQVQSSSDALLVVDTHGRKLIENRRMGELWKIPPDVAADPDSGALERWCAGLTEDPAAFLDAVHNLYSHPAEVRGGELKLKHGARLEYHSSPVIGADGRHYGRIWAFRDITERHRAEAALRSSEERFRTLVRALAQIVWRTDPGGGNFAAIPDWPEFTGQSAEEMQGRGWLEAIHPDDRARVAEEWRRAVAAGALYESEYRIRRRDGQYRDFQARGAPIKAANGAIRGWVGVCIDISERRRAERELRKFRDAVEQSSDGIVILDPDTGRILDCNAALETSGGYTREEFLAVGARQLAPEFGRTAQWRALVARGRATGQLTLETVFRRKDGSTLPVEVSGRYVSTAHGDYAVVVVRDISARRQAEAALAAAHREMLDLTRRAGMAEVATNVLHNVGNALNSVNVSAGLIRATLKKNTAAGVGRVVDLLRQHADDLGAFLSDDARGRLVLPHLAQVAEACRGDYAAVGDELDSLIRHIDHIKAIVAMQQKYARVGAVEEPVSVAAVVEDCLDMSGESLARHGIAVVRDFAELPPLKLERHKLLQILMNLVANAKHACDDARRTDAQIVVRVKAAGGGVRIEVSDNGAGISRENMARLFEHGFTTRKTGHGFGLHGCALAAKSMGGRLTAHSDGPGRGATFTLELPGSGAHGAPP